MDFSKYTDNPNVTFGNLDRQHFLLGLLSAFENRFQAMADTSFKEITWKQFFAIICIDLCKEPPAINELSEIMGSSHQNVKQILLKLKKKDFVQIYADEKDRRKQRICLTQKCRSFCKGTQQESVRIIGTLYNGISEQQLETTIQTIFQMERNVRGL